MTDKSINPTDGQEKQIKGEHFTDTGSFVDGICDTAESMLGSKPNNGYDSSVNPTHSTETRIM